jgi:exopolyphosphatase / guanosine-5'-triphosphate,3'-diphosphate pyrophosphatase
LKVAVLDLGSTSFRLVLAEADGEGRITPLSRKRASLNLGLVVGREGRIPEPQATAAVDTVARFRRQAQREGADLILTVATSALRDAANRDELTPRLQAAAREPVRFLSGQEEAALMFAALHSGLGLEGQTILGLDQGGGSLELAVGDDLSLDWAASLELGSSRLTGMFVRHDPLKMSERAALRAHAEQTLLPVAAEIARWGAIRCVAAGGTVKALARLVSAVEIQGEWDSVHGFVMRTSALIAMRERLLEAPRDRRLRMPGMNERRVDVLAAGAVVVSTLAELTGLAEITVSEWGLREGIILEALGLIQPDLLTVASA